MCTMDKPKNSVSYQKFDVRYRSSLRGLKRCSSCGEINGQRSVICKNNACELRQKLLKLQHPFDPVKLVSHTGSSYYSVLCKERHMQSRSFTVIREITLAMETNSSILSRKSICFSINCKFDERDATGVGCKHIKACTVDLKNGGNKPVLPEAEVYTLSREVLWNLNICNEQKERLWNFYKEDELQIPAVQRLNVTTFVVKCVRTKNFPAGRLHVTVTSDEVATASKKGTFACMCKHLKIILEPDNSVVMQEEICDHLLLVLATILSQPNGKATYSSFINLLQSLWMPIALNTPLVEEDGIFFDPNTKTASENNKNITETDDNIFIFDDHDLLNDENLPDLSDIILNFTPENLSDLKLMESPKKTYTNTYLNTISSDPNLMSSCNLFDDDENMEFIKCDAAVTDVCTVTSNAAAAAAAEGIISAPDEELCITNNTIATLPLNGTQLELSDCKIELMDEFQMTDQIDICSDEISLPLSADVTEMLQNNNISILSTSLNTNVAQQQQLQQQLQQNQQQQQLQQNQQQQLQQNQQHHYQQQQEQQKNPFQITTNDILNAMSVIPAICSTESLLHNQSQQQLVQNIVEPPPIEMPTIEVVKKCAVKNSKIVSEVKSRVFRIPAKRALIVNLPTPETVVGAQMTQTVDETTEPALAYSAWLEYIIETINESIEIGDKTHIVHSFHVHEEIFAHLSKTFSLGYKRRLPNSSGIVKNGKYKGLTKYTWKFSMPSTVRRIFSTKNMSLEIERAFQRDADGTFVPYIRRPIPTVDKKYKYIYPKLSLYTAHIWFDFSNKSGFKIEWLPNVFPKSHYGVMLIEFHLGIRDPPKLN